MYIISQTPEHNDFMYGQSNTKALFNCHSDTAIMSPLRSTATYSYRICGFKAKWQLLQLKGEL